MTREDAIARIKNHKIVHKINEPRAISEALDMAIKALEQEPCEDCISRQAVLEKAINVPIAKVVTEDKVIYRQIIFADDIKKLPPVTPRDSFEIKTVTNAKEAEEYPINEDVKKGFEEFTNMIFKQEESESEG